MNKKILVGSIIAVVILILVSFTGVVGYQTTKSNSVKASPLFTVRTSRAIDEENKDLTCDYVGKGKECTISIQPKANQASLVLNTLAKINKMSDDELKQLLINSNNRLYQKNIYKTLYQLNMDIIEENNNSAIGTLTADTLYTICVWFPGCIPYMLLGGLYALLLVLFLLYLKISGFTSDPCYTEYIPCI